MDSPGSPERRAVTRRRVPWIGTALHAAVESGRDPSMALGGIDRPPLNSGPVAPAALRVVIVLAVLGSILQAPPVRAAERVIERVEDVRLCMPLAEFLRGPRDRYWQLRDRSVPAGELRYEREADRWIIGRYRPRPRFVVSFDERMLSVVRISFDAGRVPADAAYDFLKHDLLDRYAVTRSGPIRTYETRRGGRPYLVLEDRFGDRAELSVLPEVRPYRAFTLLEYTARGFDRAVWVRPAPAYCTPRRLP